MKIKNILLLYIAFIVFFVNLCYTLTMVISFCGHSSFISSKEYENKLLDILVKEIKGEQVDFYLGGYGNFDRFAHRCCEEYKKKYPNAKICFVTPYIEPTYLKDRETNGYDEIIYFDLKKTPYRLKILKRNYEMVKHSDLVISCVSFSFGGAYQTLEYAKKMKKKYINIANP